MASLNEIKQILKKDLNEFEGLLFSEISTDDPLLKEKIEYLFKTKGKRVRPLLVYLVSRVFSEPQPNTHLAAVIIEVLHTATLIHDDVVDNASLRRGLDTFNKKYDNKVAVLLGDFLFAKCMELISGNAAYDLFDIISPVLIDLSYGELQQLQYNAADEYDVGKYFEVINNKTASLIAVSCVAGAHSVGVNGNELKLLHDFGLFAGQIFQISDDIIDYNGNYITAGKKSYNDIIERKMTLPLILAIKSANNNDKNKLLEVWNKQQKNEAELLFIRNFVIENKGIENSIEIMKELKKEALEILKNFEPNLYREGLEKFIDIITSRNK